LTLPEIKGDFLPKFRDFFGTFHLSNQQRQKAYI
jgi:hypothetical protein